MPGVYRPLVVFTLTKAQLDRAPELFLLAFGRTAEGPEMETDCHNFEVFKYLPDHPARDMGTFLSAGWYLLRFLLHRLDSLHEAGRSPD